VAFLTPLPTPYRQPLLERLVGSADADIFVYYFSATEADRSWHVPVPAGPRFRVLTGKSIAFMGKKSFINHWNPDLFRELDNGDFDLVVVPGYALLSSQMAIAWAWMRRKPYAVLSESHLTEPRSRMRRVAKETLVRLVVSRAAACLATGTLSREYLCHYGARPECVFFFPNTPDVDWFIRRSDELRPLRSELRRKWNVPDGPTVIFVGRLIQVKGVDVLVNAFAEVKRQLPTAQLLIVGDGPEGDSLRALVRRLKVEDNVHFLGFRQGSDLVELYVCADVFCLPSRHEPWGVVVNEAAACGLPLVVSDRVGAGPDLVCSGANGRIVPVADVGRHAASLIGTLRDCDQRENFCRVSRRQALAWGYEKAEDEFNRMAGLISEEGLRRSKQ
jgi:glycosyltransferase involved in cell wall biosynthesis